RFLLSLICCHPFQDNSLNYPAVTVSNPGTTIILTIEGVTVGEFDFAILRLQVEAYIFIGIITAIFPRPQF
ncbi:hypothetical protein AAKU58_003935, partial [Oxalobacteraceae bacterium GrIS 1.18]